MSVFVLDKRKKPLMPCSEKRARKLLDAGRAVVVRVVPFTIRLKDRVGGEVQPLQVKLDPGSKTTGIALVRVEDETDPESGEMRRTVHPLWLGHLQHRGAAIREALQARRALRAVAVVKTCAIVRHGSTIAPDRKAGLHPRYGFGWKPRCRGCNGCAAGRRFPRSLLSA